MNKQTKQKSHFIIKVPMARLSNKYRVFAFKTQEQRDNWLETQAWHLTRSKLASLRIG